jgi:hypothetical protein
MTVIRVKGFQIFSDRHGRCYHRRTHTAVDLSKAPIGSAEFFAECSRIAELSQKVEPKPGALGLLINGYRAHSAFTDLAPLTRRDYQKVFDYLKPIADTPPRVVRALSRIRTPPVSELRQSVPLPPVRLGLRARLHRDERGSRNQRNPPPQGGARGQPAVER